MNEDNTRQHLLVTPGDVALVLLQFGSDYGLFAYGADANLLWFERVDSGTPEERVGGMVLGDGNDVFIAETDEPVQGNPRRTDDARCDRVRNPRRPRRRRRC